MVVFENFYLGYDGVTKKIINYHLAESYEVAKKAAKEYVKRFFPTKNYKISKEESDRVLVYTLVAKENLGNSRDVEFVSIYEQNVKSSEDFTKIFNKYQENIDKRHREVMGISEFDFVIEKT